MPSILVEITRERKKLSHPRTKLSQEARRAFDNYCDSNSSLSKRNKKTILIKYIIFCLKIKDKRFDSRERIDKVFNSGDVTCPNLWNIDIRIIHIYTYTHVIYGAKCLNLYGIFLRR